MKYREHKTPLIIELSLSCVLSSDVFFTRSVNYFTDPTYRISIPDLSVFFYIILLFTQCMSQNLSWLSSVFSINILKANAPVRFFHCSTDYMNFSILLDWHLRLDLSTVETATSTSIDPLLALPASGNLFTFPCFRDK